MILVTVTYPYDESSSFDLARYGSEHATLVVERLQPLGLRHFCVERPVVESGEKPAWFARAALGFDSMNAFTQAMEQCGNELGDDAAKCGDVQGVIEFSEIAHQYSRT